MKKIILLFAILMFGVNISNAQNHMLLPSTVDSVYNMYPVDSCKCYIVVIENIGFGDWAESEPITWIKAFEWMTKGNDTYPSSYWILNICDIQKRCSSMEPKDTITIEITVFRPGAEKNEVTKTILTKDYKPGEDSVIYFWYSSQQLLTESALQDWKNPVRRRIVEGEEFTITTGELKEPIPDAVLVYEKKKKK